MKVKRIFKGYTEKEWVKVLFEFLFENDDNWLPKLEDIAYICHLLYEIEDNKYKRGRGGEMVRDYINEAMDGVEILELNKKYLLPDADNPNEKKFELFNTDEN